MFENIKVGYCALGDINGFPLDYLERIREEGINLFREENLSIYEFPKILSNFNEVNNLIKFFKYEKKVEIIILNFASWVQAGITIKIFNELDGIPIILWAFGNYNQTLTLTGLIEATSSLTKIGKKYNFLIGPPSSSIRENIFSLINSFSVIKSIKNSNIGLIGYNSPGMLDSVVDEISLRKKFGCEFLYLTLTELFNNLEEISEEQVESTLTKFKLSKQNILISKKDLVGSVKLYYALRKLCKFHNIEGFAIRCWPELKNNLCNYNMTPCFAIAALINEGIVGACESDISSTITMMILNKISGNHPVVLDYNTFNLDRNSISLWHCGANSFKLAENVESIKLRYPTNGGLKELNSGMAVEFFIKKGNATVAKLDREYKKMLIAEGNFIRPMPVYRGGIAELKLKIPVINFLKRTIEEGFEHHLCLVHGDFMKKLEIICKLLEIDTVKMD